MYSREDAQTRRDRKVHAAMRRIGPAWLINDEFRPLEESFLFDLVYPHSEYGWVQCRYKYDAFNDVLYHMGERHIGEVEALAVQEQAAYLDGEVATAVPNHPRPRGY